MARKENWHPIWDKKTNSWVVDFRVRGERIRRRLSVRDRKLKDVAISLARDLHEEVWAKALRVRENNRLITFEEAAERYTSAGGEERFLEKITRYLGPKVLVQDVDAAVMARAAKDLYLSAKRETIRRQLTVPVRAVQNFASGKRRESVPDTRRTRWLTPEEAERLLIAAANPETSDLRDPDKQTLRKIAFMLGTGAGPGETMALNAEGWNPDTREWWLPGTKTVFRSRFVNLPQRALLLIGDIPKSGPAFPAPNGQPYIMRQNGGGQMAEAFRKVRTAAGLGSDVVPYTMRHTWATWFYSQTKDWGGLLDHGGWNRADTANRYRKIAPSDLGNRLLAHGWDFRRYPGDPVRFGELVSV